MRTPDEVRELIIDIAQKDENIRAVLMTGSRANPGLCGGFVSGL